MELKSRLRGLIGSTGSGTGAAVMRRISRKENGLLARDCYELQPFLTDVSAELSVYRKQAENIVIEGTQGFGLSIYHSESYPYVTSRDTTASGFISEVGISPRNVDEIVLVIRAFPIRAGGNSGPLANECTWKDVAMLAGSDSAEPQYTSLTHRMRRVAYFDPEIVIRAIQVNNSSVIILNHVDYIDWSIHGARKQQEITDKSLNFVYNVQKHLNTAMHYIRTGPCAEHLVELKRSKGILDPVNLEKRRRA